MSREKTWILSALVTTLIPVEIPVSFSVVFNGAETDVLYDKKSVR